MYCKKELICMNEQDEKKIEEAMREALKDPTMVKELQALRERGMSETYVQNYLRQIVLLRRL